MRITCPNCNAQYEIAVDMIPADGRDVQCSNCGTTWYQEGRGREVDAEAAAPRAAPRAPAAARDSAQDGPTPRRPLADDRALGILREEREREDRLRAAAGASGVQGGSGDPRRTAAREAARMSAAASVARARDATDSAPEPVPTVDDDVADAIAQIMGDGQFDEDAANANGAGSTSSDGNAPAAQDAAPSSRRELLPDIEEINSSLRPDERAAEAAAEAAADAAAAQPQTGGGGFRLGFVVVIGLMMLCVLAYLFADPIAMAIPALGGAMDSFVGVVERGRIGLEAGAESLLQMIGPDA
ncbi:MAG: zinc-ribbon domain-containing protein [Pseudomonadota bacterium]